ncbi:hypothetical protein [Halopelagius longus]|uniref:hypothetical protein n=1 Tax=Halopelagius longus TaxID=1236180 RepID=UPI0011137952|nr:hypothetical protein [Halopelagius longus]
MSSVTSGVSELLRVTEQFGTGVDEPNHLLETFDVVEQLRILPSDSEQFGSHLSLFLVEFFDRTAFDRLPTSHTEDSSLGDCCWHRGQVREAIGLLSSASTSAP